MKNSLFAAVVACVITLTVVFTTKTFAQAKSAAKPDLSKLQVVTYASGLTGFFDAGTGMLYIYDSNWDKCIWVRQITELGQPMLKVKDL